MYTLAANGDDFEKECDGLFLRREFPHYEVFWRTFVVPLTNRDETPPTINFKDSAPTGDVCIAQLHYTVLRHLHVAYLVKRHTPWQTLGVRALHALGVGIGGLCSAWDVADELQARFSKHFVPSPGSVFTGGLEARKGWRRRKNPDPTPPSGPRKYRNHLTHGLISPSLVDNGGRQMVPKMGCEEGYFDWRTVTGGGAMLEDFDFPSTILEECWAQVLGYLRESWEKHLDAHI